MTFVQMGYFLEVAKQKNITKAAEMMFVSQQVISRQIQAIEKELNMKLFERTNKGIILTEAGEHMFLAWEEVLEKHEAAIETAKVLHAKGKFRIRIGIQELDGIIDYMIPILTTYMEVHKNVEIDYFFGTPVWLYDKFKNNKIDAMMAFSSEIKDLENTWSVNYGTMGIRFGFVASCSSSFGKKDKIEIKELENTTVLIPQTTYSRDATQRTLAYLNERGCYPKRIKYFDNISSLEMAVQMGEGVAVAYNALFRNINKTLKFFEWENIMGDEETQLVLVGQKEKYYEFAKEMKEMFRERN